MLSSNKILSSHFDWYLREVLPIVVANATQKPYGYHGLYTHTSAVVFRGIDYALSINQDPRPVILASACHDMARTTDDDEPGHGANAIPLVKRIMDNIGNIDNETRLSIIYAVRNHSLNLPAPDNIAKCLWDADRTRLSWDPVMGGYRPECFATDRAKSVAAAKPQLYLDFMWNAMSEPAREIIKHVDKRF